MMPSLGNYLLFSRENVRIFSIIFIVFVLATFSYSALSTHSISLFAAQFGRISLETNPTNISLIFTMDQHLLNLKFSPGKIYHHDGIAYDYYSKNDFNQSKAGAQWKVWPLPGEIHQLQNTPSIKDIQTSPFIVSKLPFVDKIYLITDPRLTERHANLKKAFHQQGISFESIDWRLKWNQTTCNSESSHSYVYQRLNFIEKPLSKYHQKKCALLMKQVDVWYEMAEKKVPLGLILEDDVVFVPFFKEKLTRMIYAAYKSGVLRINGTCVQSKGNKISAKERIHQNPMIMIGTCFKFDNPHFPRHLANARPFLSTHKSAASRCAHSYLLTACSAQGLVDQIHRQKNKFLPVDTLQDHLIRLSSTLQSFWLDPPLVYQGNKVIDMDNLSTFKFITYMKSL